MEEARAGHLLERLARADLVALRLAAQVLQHKAELTGRAAVAVYFRRLEYSAEAQLASQLTGIRAVATASEPVLDDDADSADRLLLGQYLGLLAENQQLSAELRLVCRELLGRLSP